MIQTAKSYENVAKRTKLQDSPETRKLLLDDAVKNVERELDKEGHTGYLGSPDGVIQGMPQKYRGFFIQCYGMLKYESELDVFGHLVWFGWAKLKKKVLDRTETIQFDAFDKTTEHEAGNYLINLIDIYFKATNGN